MDAKRTGALIASRRQELSLTQKQVAEQLNVSDRTVSKWERGAGFPDVSLLEPIADALGLSLIELMHGERLSEKEQPSEEAEQTSRILKADLDEYYENWKKKRRRICFALFWIIVFNVVVFITLRDTSEPRALRANGLLPRSGTVLAEWSFGSGEYKIEQKVERINTIDKGLDGERGTALVLLERNSLGFWEVKQIEICGDGWYSLAMLDVRPIRKNITYYGNSMPRDRNVFIYGDNALKKLDIADKVPPGVAIDIEQYGNEYTIRLLTFDRTDLLNWCFHLPDWLEENGYIEFPKQ